MAKNQSQFKERDKVSHNYPRQYKVFMYNDDFTTMEFVVMVLTRVFLKPEPEAERIMLTIHRSEFAMVGIYSYDVAKTRVNMATAMAREEGFPLRITMEPTEHELPF